MAQSIQLISNPDASHAGYQGEPVVYNGNLYIKYQNAGGRIQLAKLSGNTLTLIPNPNAGSINVFDGNTDSPFVVYNGNLYFQYLNTNGHYQLAKYNGVAVSLIANPLPGTGNVGDPNVDLNPYFVQYNNKLYFLYNSIVAGKQMNQLAVYNGVSSSIVPNPDLAVDPDGYITDPILYNNMLYINYVNSAGIAQLGQYDGTTLTLIPNPDGGAGYEGIDGGGNNTPIVYNGNLYFNYMNAAGVSQMAKSDGTSITLVPNPDATIYGTYFDQPPIVFNNQLYFEYINSTGNFQMAAYDGTSISLLPFPAGVGFPSVTLQLQWEIFNNTLMVQNYDQVGYLHLAQSNGLSTTMLATPVGGTQYNGSLITYNNALYANYQNSAGNFQLAQYDGTAPIKLLPNITGSDIGYAGSPIVVNNKLYIRYQNASFTYQLAYIADCPTIKITASDTSICPGTDVTFNVLATDAGNSPVYEWAVNGVNAFTGLPYDTDSLRNNDTVVCTLTNKTSACTATAPADSLIMTVFPAAVISLSGVSCQDSVLTATTGNATDTITWLRNGVPVLKQPVSAGTTYTAVTPASYSAMVTTMHNCTSFSTDTIIVSAPLVPSVSIAASTNNVCKGVKIDFTATPVNGGPHPFYQWKVNGVNAGIDSSVFSSTTLNNNDTVSCWMSSSYGCVTVPTVISDSILLVIIDSPAVMITIGADHNNVCFRTPVTFAAIPVKQGPSPTYQWMLNGSNVGSNTTSYSNDTLSNGSAVKCILTSTAACTIPVSSNTISMVIYPLPVITSIPDTTIPVNGHLTLDLPITGTISTYSWSPAGTLSDAAIRNPVATPLANTNYQLTVHSTDGCMATGEEDVDVFTALYMPNAFTPNDDGKDDIFRIPTSINIHIDFFSVFDRWGNEVFTTTDPTQGWDGTYTGLPTAMATYVWVIQYRNPITGLITQAKGTVLLIH